MAYDSKLFNDKVFKLRATTVAPTAVANLGDIRYADGTGWDPGSGKGYYGWNGSYWEPMGLMLGAQEGFRDLPTDINVRGTGANDPTWSAFFGNIYAYKFDASTMKQAWANFHINHDYAAGTPLYLHLHWSTAGTNTGVVRWGFEYSIAKGHNQGNFPATTTLYVEQDAQGTAYRHMIAETVAISDAAIEVDSIIMCRVFRDAAHVNDTCTDAAFGFYADVHYQSDRFATKNRAPSFYA